MVHGFNQVAVGLYSIQPIIISGMHHQVEITTMDKVAGLVMEGYTER